MKLTDGMTIREIGRTHDVVRFRATLDPAAVTEAFTRAAAVIGKAFSEWQKNMLRAFAPRRAARPPIPPHAFKAAGYDLVCGVCGRGPEECGR